ncbi:MAG: GNAT family N-acetyltransferase [Armatimonadota bacterium]
MPDLADIYVDGFSSKFAWAGITPDVVRQVFIKLIEVKAMAHDEIIVARVDNHPAGMMIMQTRTEVPPPLPWLKAWHYASMAKSLYQRYGLTMMVQVATSRWPRKDNVYISSLSVATAYRNRGIAKAMLDYAITTGIGLGRKWVDLDVLPSNHVAIHVYDSCGFTMSRVSELGYMARLSTGESKMNRMSRLLVAPREPIA